MTKLSVGDAAPAFTVSTHTGASATLASLGEDGKKSVLLWFYPRASTGG